MRKAIEKKNCEYSRCKRLFRPVRTFQKYCSTSCKHGGWWERKLETVRRAEAIIKERAGL